MAGEVVKKLDGIVYFRDEWPRGTARPSGAKSCHQGQLRRRPASCCLHSLAGIDINEPVLAMQLFLLIFRTQAVGDARPALWAEKWRTAPERTPGDKGDWHRLGPGF